MAQGHLLTAETWPDYTRMVSVHMDAREVEAFIDECEQIHIVPAIGTKLFLRLVSGDVLNDKETLLLEGGVYQGGSVRTEIDGDVSTFDRTFGCSFTDEDILFKGLRHALAYFVLAKMVKNDGAMLSRGGMFLHEDEHAGRMDDRGRVDRYNDIMNTAEMYMSGALAYLKTWKGREKTRKANQTRIRIKSIGE